MNKYEVVLFDLDDTLIDNIENVRYAYTKMIESFGLIYTDEGFKKWYELDKKFWVDFHNNKIEVPEEYRESQELFVKFVRSKRYQLYFENKISIEEAFKINDLFLTSLNEVVVPIDGAYETLQFLHDKYRIVVATNGPSTAAYSKLEKIKVLNFVDSVFSADMTKQVVTKPSRAYFEELMDYIKYYDNEKMLIVGDSLKTDIQEGMNALIDSCWFNQNNDDLTSTYQPTYVINDLRQLIRKL